MAEAKQKFSMKGTLLPVEKSSGTKANGSEWVRASIKLTKDGRTFTAGTFEREDIAIAESLEGRYVQLIYTKNVTPTGTFHNLVKGQITEVVDEDALEITEEYVEDSSSQQPVAAVPIQPVEQPKIASNGVPARTGSSDTALRAKSIELAIQLVCADKIKLEEAKTFSDGIVMYIVNGQ